MTKKEFNIAFGQSIAKQRKARGWTLDNLVEILGNSISRSTLSSIEHGRQELNCYEFFILEKMLGEIPRPNIKVTFE